MTWCGSSQYKTLSKFRLWTNIGIMSRLPRPKHTASRAAEGDGAEVFLKSQTLRDQILLQVWHVRHRVHVDILVIGQDKEDVRLRR